VEKLVIEKWCNFLINFEIGLSHVILVRLSKEEVESIANHFIIFDLKSC